MIRCIGPRIVIVALSVSSLLFVAAAAELKPGDPAPPFSLKGSDGKTYSLDQFKGEKCGCDRVVSQGVYQRLHGGMQVSPRKQQNASRFESRVLHRQRRFAR